MYLALLHNPMYNKRSEVITTSISNLDLHDISRATKTYDLDGFFVVHHVESQQEIIRQILSYWQEGYGATYNKDRKEAFEIIKLASNLEEVQEIILQETSLNAISVATDARLYPNTLDYKELKEKINNQEEAILLLFGTGWGIAKEAMEGFDYILKPIVFAGEYNHLSVRSAVSIILDRLLGEDWYD